MALEFGPDEDYPEGTPDSDLALAFQCVELESLPRSGGILDQPSGILDLMLLVQSVRAEVTMPKTP